jgi:hypothetical protein
MRRVWLGRYRAAVRLGDGRRGQVSSLQKNPSAPLTYCVLRYFNVAGADSAGRSGQSTREPFHLIHVAAQAALDRRQSVGVFGTDYPTADGFCIRRSVPWSGSRGQDADRFRLVGLRRVVGEALAGTKRRFSSLSHIRRSGNEVLRMFV